MSRRQQQARGEFRDRETGGVRKKWKDKLPIALLFPNRYRVGMSNLGLQVVYGLLNDDPDIVCERLFLPEASGGQPLSVESNRPLGDFPLIFCSLSFEDDYPNLPAMLVAAGLIPLADERGGPGLDASITNGAPLVVAGGVAALINPEPLAPFVDCFVLGEAEVALPQLLALLKEGVATGRPRGELLYSAASQLAGCYAPAFYSPRYDEEGRFASFEVVAGLPSRVGKVVLRDRETAGHSQVLSPDAEFSDLFLTELGRGCSRGCRFCAAGFVYRPPRLWAAEAIVKALAARPAAANRIGLLGMEMARAEDLAVLADYLLAESCALSFSSLRADVIGPELLALLGASGLKSAAIAPDGGSERLRRVINKGITEPELLAAASALTEAGVTNLKLYYMIGLPTETDEDLNEMADLTIRIRNRVLAVGRAKRHMGTITLSVNCFVPKPWTPFQFHPFVGVAELKRRLQFLRKRLTGQANIRIVADQPGRAFFQATLARGDRRLGRSLLALCPGGGNWRQAMAQRGVEAEAYACRERGEDEPFPWEVVDHGIDRRYLWEEYQKAMAARLTVPCDTSRCRRCGVCHGN